MQGEVCDLEEACLFGGRAAEVDTDEADVVFLWVLFHLAGELWRWGELVEESVSDALGQRGDAFGFDHRRGTVEALFGKALAVSGPPCRVGFGDILLGLGDVDVHVWEGVPAVEGRLDALVHAVFVCDAEEAAGARVGLAFENRVGAREGEDAAEAASADLAEGGQVVVLVARVRFI